MIPYPDIRIWICPIIATLADLGLPLYSWRRKSKGIPREDSPTTSLAPICSFQVLAFHTASRLPIPLLTDSPQPHEMTPSCFLLLWAMALHCHPRQKFCTKQVSGALCGSHRPHGAYPQAQSCSHTALTQAVASTSLQMHIPSLAWATAEKLRWAQIILFLGHFFEDWLVTWNCDQYQLSSYAMQQEFPAIQPSDVCQYVFNSSLLHIKYSKRCKTERNE